MELTLISPEARFTSASQIARTATEGWTEQNFYCPACGMHLSPFPTGEKVYDFYSSFCNERFQLKSSAHTFSETILGSEFRTTVNSILNNRQPSFILLHYDKIKWVVQDLLLVHRACITSSCIMPRTPLSPTARRAGWQGCTISLAQIPKLGQIEVIRRGIVTEKSEVLAQWKQSNSLLQTRPQFRGWVADVLACVEKLLTTFTLDDMYGFEEDLGGKHPENHNIRPKIRQQLQVLRDLGLVRFVNPGVYEYLGKRNNNTGTFEKQSTL